MTAVRARKAERIKGAAAAAALLGVIGYALVLGFAVGFPSRRDDPLKLFAPLPDPPPPPREKVAARPKSKRPDGAASPPNLRAKATELVAPTPIVPPVAPPPLPTTAIAGVGAQSFSGAAEVRGPGTGSGGQGNGTGSGDGGDGNGDGGDETPPRQIKGRLKMSDYPAEAPDGGRGLTVSVRYTVTASGRVTGCAVTRSSGIKVLDDTTCRVIEQRFRFVPSRDADGEAVESIIVENHTWGIDPETESPR